MRPPLLPVLILALPTLAVVWVLASPPEARGPETVLEAADAPRAAAAARAAPPPAPLRRRPAADDFAYRIVQREESPQAADGALLSLSLLAAPECRGWPVEVLLAREGMGAEGVPELCYGVVTASAASQVRFQSFNAPQEPRSGWSLWVGGYPVVERLDLTPGMHTWLELDLGDLAWLRVTAGSAATPLDTSEWGFLLDGASLPPPRRAVPRGQFSPHRRFLQPLAEPAPAEELALGSRTLLRRPGKYGYRADRKDSRWQLRRELELALGPQELHLEAPAGSIRFRRPAVESRGSFDDSLYGMLLPSRWDGAIYRDSDRLLLAPRPEKGTTAAVQMKKLREETVSFDAVPEGEFRLACWDELTGYRQSEPVQVHGEVVEVELGRLVRGSRILVETEGMDFGAGMLSIGVLNLETGWFPPAKFLRPTGSAVFDEVPPGRYQAYWGRLGRTSRVLGFSDPFLVDAEAGLTVPMAARASLARSCPLIARGSR